MDIALGVKSVVFDRAMPEKSILDYCELPRSRDELAAFTRLENLGTYPL